MWASNGLYVDYSKGMDIFFIYDGEPVISLEVILKVLIVFWQLIFR